MNDDAKLTAVFVRVKKILSEEGGFPFQDGSDVSPVRALYLGLIIGMLGRAIEANTPVSLEDACLDDEVLRRRFLAELSTLKSRYPDYIIAWHKRVATA